MNLHTFRLKIHRRTRNTRIQITRDYDRDARKWRNAYSLTLTEEGRSLAGKQLEFWYVERHQPGYDSHNAMRLAERMKAGGERLRPVTDERGVARVELPARFDKITDPHLSYQFIARFNIDRSDPDYKPYQSPQLELYAFAPMQAALNREENKEK